MVPQDIPEKEATDARFHEDTFGERMQDVDIPFIQAAKAFRPLLLEHRCSNAEMVLKLIAERKELQIWRKWHSKLEGETATILQQVVDVVSPLTQEPS